MATASVENNMNELFNKVKHSLKFKGTKKEIQPYIEKMDTSFLLEPNPSIKDWGKDLPRYTEFFTMTFGEGHPQFNFLLELLVETGLVGSLLYMYFLSYIIISITKIMKFLFSHFFFIFYKLNKFMKIF